MANLDLASLVVCDAGPLIHLDELNCLDLLSVYTNVYVPEMVWQEVSEHRPAALLNRHLSLRHVDFVPAATAEVADVIQFFELEAGEEEALRLMQQYPQAKLLSDDGAARKAAARLGYTVQGTIGVLVQAFERGQRTKRQVLRTLRAIPHRSTLHIRQRFLEEIIDKVRGA